MDLVVVNAQNAVLGLYKITTKSDTLPRLPCRMHMAHKNNQQRHLGIEAKCDTFPLIVSYQYSIEG